MYEGLRTALKLQNSYLEARERTIELCQPLFYDDYLVQSADFVSPPKWHLGHTTWFFETFVLQPFGKGFEIFNDHYREVFSLPRPGFSRCFARPTLEETLMYREHVDDAVVQLLGTAVSPEALHCVQLGIEREEQHQENLLMDIQHNFFRAPIQPSYEMQLVSVKPSPNVPTEFVTFHPQKSDDFFLQARPLEASSVYKWGRPKRMRTSAFRLANRLSTNGEYIDFIESGGYENPMFWSSEGWEQRQKNQWMAPLYWSVENGYWHHYTLRGPRRLRYDEPVAHVSYYEAEAFARWKGARLPSENEWNVAAESLCFDGNFLEESELYPEAPLECAPGQVLQMYGDLWEWTSTEPAAGKRELRDCRILAGGSFATPKARARTHACDIRRLDQRWHFCGIRLACELEPALVE